MSNIKKFRIKSFKNKEKSILKLEKISLKFGRKIILDNLNLKLQFGRHCSTPPLGILAFLWIYAHFRTKNRISGISHFLLAT